MLRLTSEVVRKQLGNNIFEASNEYRLTSWLAQQEDRNIITLYQCDSSLSPWTQRCMRQADVVLIVGLGERSHMVGKFEREIDKLAMRTQKELVLLYPETTNARPANTLSWLNARPWVTKHHHVLCVKRIFTRKSQYRIVSGQHSIFHIPFRSISFHLISDFSLPFRMICIAACCSPSRICIPISLVWLAG